MDNTLDDLQESFVCNTIEDVQELQSEHEKFKAGELQDASTKYEQLNGLVTQMADLGSSDNPYTTLTPQVMCVCVWCMHACVHSVQVCLCIRNDTCNCTCSIINYNTITGRVREVVHSPGFRPST